MNNYKERSASAIQIEEKKARIEAMYSLSQDLTKEQISEIKQKNSNLTPIQILEQVKKKGIKRMEFINEYIVQVSVSLAIAEGYFEVLAHRLKPNFTEFNPSNARVNTHFHLQDGVIQKLITEVEKDASLVAKKSGKVR